MPETSPHTAKRLAIIDLYLAFKGRVQRSDLIRHFDIGVATASRTMKEYRDRYPDNIDYSISDRTYITPETFSAAYTHDIGNALRLMAYGTETSSVGGDCYGIASPAQLTASMSIGTVSQITRAMVSKSVVTIEYSSGSSGETKRNVAPNAIFEAGGTWYFRCYDFNREDFRTFRFSRVKAAFHPEGIEHSIPEQSEDHEWNTEIVLTVGPHPYRSNQDALREDLGLTDKPVKNIVTNAAITGFVLTDLRADCSKEGTLNPYEYPIRLLNRHDLEDIDSMSFAPGFQKKGISN